MFRFLIAVVLLSTECAVALAQQVIVLPPYRPIVRPAVVVQPQAGTTVIYPGRWYFPRLRPPIIIQLPAVTPVK